MCIVGRDIDIDEVGTDACTGRTRTLVLHIDSTPTANTLCA